MGKGMCWFTIIYLQCKCLHFDRFFLQGVCVLLEFLHRGINPLHFTFFYPIEFAASQMYLLSGGISTCSLHKRNWKFTHSCVKYCYVVPNWVQLNSETTLYVVLLPMHFLEIFFWFQDQSRMVRLNINRKYIFKFLLENRCRNSC